MGVTPTAFYHVAGIGHWKEIVAEQIGLLARSGFPGRIHVGFIGKEHEDGFIRHVAEAAGIDAAIRRFGGDFSMFEFPTQEWMHQHVQGIDHSTPVLYFHGKGVSRNDWQWTMWRWLMNAYCLAEWRDMVASLANHNCAGVSWHANAFPVSYFPGNFWWATAGFISQLTEIPDYVVQFTDCITKHNTHGFTKRHAAECWINSRCNANPCIFGPQESRMWDHRWWTAAESQQWCQIAYQKGH
ncbi:MAG: hypothetical protein LLG20_22680 [Acidobacteriales bacterium]|nr:hypothetical protein [Terriglobales bacterium]